MADLHSIVINLTAKATQMDSELRKAQATIKGLEGTVAQLQDRMRQTAGASGQVTTSLRGMGSSGGMLVGQLKGLAAGYLGVQAAAQGMQAIFAAGMRVEQQQRAWAAIAGGAKQANAELSFLRGTADRLGVSFVALEEGYRQVAAASKGTALEGQATREIFTAVTQAMQTLGASSESLQGALRAISQSISSGVVQSEELRGQLSEHLPGAMQIASRATGQTTAALMKQMEAGQVLAVDFWPKFAKALTTQFAPATETAGQATRTLSQEIARVGNVLSEMSAVVAKESGLMSWATSLLKVIADIGAEANKSKAAIRLMQETGTINARSETEALIKGQRAGLGPLPQAEVKVAADEYDALTKSIAENMTTMRHWQKMVQEPHIVAAIEKLGTAQDALFAKRAALLARIGAGPETASTQVPRLSESAQTAQGVPALMTEQTARAKRFAEQVDAIATSTLKLGTSLEGLMSPAEIAKRQLDSLTKEMEKLQDTIPSIPSQGSPQTLAYPGQANRAPESMRALFAASGAKYGVDPLRLESIASVETRGSFKSDLTSPAGAQGLMQFMPGTARDMGLKDPFNIAQSIEAGAKYFAQQLERFGTIPLALAAYNAGPGNVAKAGNAIPRIKETQDYVRFAEGAYAQYGGTPATMQQAGSSAAANPMQRLMELRSQLTAKVEGSARLEEGERNEAARNLADRKARVDAADEHAEAVERLIAKFETLTTAEDAATRTTEIANIARQAAAGDSDGMRESLERLGESLSRSNVGMNVNERAIATRSLETILAANADADTTQGILEHVAALDKDASAIEATKKWMKDMAEVQRGIADANEIIARTEAGKQDAILQTLATIEQGLPTMAAYEEQLLKLQGLGANERVIARAKELRKESDVVFLSMREGAENLAMSLEDTLIASLTRGGDAWKQFGQIAVEELLRILLNATQFRQTLTGLLTKAGEAIIGIVGSYYGVNTSAGENLRGYGGPTGRAAGGGVGAGQLAQVGEQGRELLIGPGGMRLVGQHGPEMIRPRQASYVVPHQATMQLLRTGKPPMRVANAMTRAAGGPMNVGDNYLAGEQGVEAVMSMQRGGASERPVIVNMTVNAKDAPSFLRSGAEVKRAAALAFQDAQRSL